MISMMVNAAQMNNKWVNMFYFEEKKHKASRRHWIIKAKAVERVLSDLKSCEHADFSVVLCQCS